MHEVHTIWSAPDELTAKALRGAWDVVPALVDSHGCCDVPSGAVVRMLDDYVHDLVITGTKHTLDNDGGLSYRFESRLGLVLPHHEHEHADPHFYRPDAIAELVEARHLEDDDDG